MNDLMRLEILRQFHGGASCRTIARSTGVNRKTVAAVIRAYDASRHAPHSALPSLHRRGSQLDRFDETIQGLVARYPDITAVRLHEELRAAGFTGGHTIVKDRLRAIRPRASREPVVRFETGPGAQAQMDYSPFDIDFTEEGRRRVYAFQLILSYSRRRYLRFVESQDFPTTIREHVRAFTHLNGIAPVCLYDSMKVVVHHWDGEEPIYNLRFLAFAFHYGFRPWACRRHRPQTKGKIERPFLDVSLNLLNARSFASLAALNAFVADTWLPQIDRRPHGTTKCPPLERWEEERAHLLPLPAHQYDTALVLYRTVGPEWRIPYQQNVYTVPASQIGRTLPVRITETELIVYGRDLQELTRHALEAPGAGKTVSKPEHAPSRDEKRRHEELAERFAELGSEGPRFLEDLVRARRYGWDEAHRVLALLATYARADVIAALERACRYRAFSLTAVERILSAQAHPKSPLDVMGDQAHDQVAALIAEEPVRPRPTGDYATLFEGHSDESKDDDAS
jgi:transposase